MPSTLSWLRRVALALAFALPAIAAAQTADQPFSKEQLDQLTAQVALFPDALLAQVLMAATYPADVAEAAAWSRANSNQKGDEAVTMVQNEPWDPSVQSLVAFPQVVIMMGEKPQWVKDLGDAFLMQPEDVMDSVQRLRAAAQRAGNLQSNNEVIVNVETSPPPTVIIETSAPPPPPQVIVIEQRNPDVIFVPVYNPTYVFGPWMWPAFPPVFIPPPPGFWFSSAVATGIAWGVGIGVRNAVWGQANWWGRNVNINVNHFNNINVNRRIDVNNSRWSHNVDRRGNVPYRGGDATRRNLQDRAQQVNREQFRGRDADRQRAQQALQNRGVNTDRSALRDVDRQRVEQSMQNRGAGMDRGQLQDRAANIDRGSVQNRAQSVDRSQLQDRAANVDRGSMQNRAQSVDRSQLQDRAQSFDRGSAQNRAQSVDRSQLQNRAQSFDRGSAQSRAQNSAFQGVGDRQARSEINRGQASRQSMQQVQRPSGGGGGAARPQVQRPSGGGGARAGGGGGGGRR